MDNNVSNKDRLVRSSFYITYAFLITTATITFIEAIRTNNSKIRHILNLETVISIIAGFFYTEFIKKIQNKEIDYREINMTRYIDWAITTPVMILVLCLVMAYNSNKSISASYMLLLFVVNYLMLGFGYMGEVKTIDRNVALGLGSLSFIVLYGIIYYSFLNNNSNFDNSMIFWAFVIFWAFYGVFYNLKDEDKNVGYNVLDLFSKCFVGIFFWAYLTKVIVIF